MKNKSIKLECPKCGELQQLSIATIRSVKNIGCCECRERSPVSAWAPQNIYMTGTYDKTAKENQPDTQREKIMEILLRGQWIDRKQTIDRYIAWELSARVDELEKFYCVKLLRTWVLYGTLRCRAYRLRDIDIENIRDDMRNNEFNERRKIEQLKCKDGQGGILESSVQEIPTEGGCTE